MRSLVIRLFILLGLLPTWLRVSSLLKRALPAMLVLLLALLGAGPVAGADWAANYGSAGANTYTSATAVDASGNVYIAGTFDSATLTLGSVTLTKIGALDAFVAKLDASGAVVWAQDLGAPGGGSSSGISIAVDGTGHVYLGGSFTGNKTIAYLNGSNAFALKLDSFGNWIWVQSFGGTGGDEQVNSIAVDGTGNVYLGGKFSGTLTTPALTSLGWWGDAFVLKLDSSGNTIWAKNFGGTTSSIYSSIAVDGTGNVYLGGNFSGTLTTPALTSLGMSDAFALKLDSSGNTIWAKNFGGARAAPQNGGFAVDGAGNVYLSGIFNANLTTPALSLIGIYDAYALKLDSFGNTIWAKSFGGAGSTAQGTSIAVDGIGNVYLGGGFGGNLTTPALTSTGGNDAFVAKLDASGAVVWAKNFGGAGTNTHVSSIAVNGTGNVYLGGDFYNWDLTTPALTKIGNTDAFIIKQMAAYVTLRPGQADCVFSWAERTYPAYFSPAGAPSATFPPYYYRYYSGTGNYLATSSADNNLYAIGTATGNRLVNVGPVTNLLGVSGCP